MQLTALEQELVLYFGEMGSRRGIDRAVGCIHALPFSRAKRTSARTAKTSTRSKEARESL